MNLEQNVSVWLEDLLVFWLFPLISLLNLAPNSGIRLFFSQVECLYKITHH